MRAIPLALVLALALPLAAAARSGAPQAPRPTPYSSGPRALGFTPFASGGMQRRGSPRANRIYIARTSREAKRWKNWLPLQDYSALQKTNFSRTAMLGVFFNDRDVSSVAVTGMEVKGDTLSLSVEVVPFPTYICTSLPGTICTVASVRVPPANLYALVAVGKPTLGPDVRRIVVTREEDDPPAVIDMGSPPELPPG